MPMINQRQMEWIAKWQSDNGGSYQYPQAHGLKTLEECVELCLAMGASPIMIHDRVQDELTKQAIKNKRGYEYSSISVASMVEEMADVQICLGITEIMYQLNTETAIDVKIPVLESRQWTPDAFGILRRPK